MIMDRRSFLALLAAPALPANSRQTAVSIDGDRFLINGKPTYQGRQYEGMRIEGALDLFATFFTWHHAQTESRAKAASTSTLMAAGCIRSCTRVRGSRSP